MSVIKDKRILHIWWTVKVVKATMGLTFGLYLFTYGPYLYEKFGGDADPKMGMFLGMAWLITAMTLVAALEVPTGAIGDAIGRVSTVVWSFSFRMLFFLLLAVIAPFTSIAISFTIATLSAVAFAIAHTLFSGTFTAWVVDSMREIAPDVGYEHILSRGYTYEFISQLAGSAIGVLCYQYHMAYAAYITAAFICLFCATFCRAQMQEPTNIEFLDKTKTSGKAILKRMGEIIAMGFNVCKRTNSIFWLIMIFAGYMFLLNIVDQLWPVYTESIIQDKIQQTTYWIGLGFLFLVSNIIGSYIMTQLGNRWNKNGGAKTHNSTLRKWFIASTIFASLPVLVLSTVASYYGGVPFLLFIAATFAVEFSYGIIAPSHETLLNNYIPDSHAGERATIMSFGSMLRGLVILLFAIPSGGTSGTTTVTGWAIPAGLLFICTIVGWNCLKRNEAAEPFVESIDVEVVKE